VGECGLDYVKVKDQNTQRFFFDEQVALATRFDLPLIIHSVHATEDVTDLLKSYSKSRGVIHAYSGSLQQAENLLKINFSFGFGAALTNPHAYKLHDIVKFLPIESIVIETDDRNNPDELIQVAERVARIKKNTVEEVIEQCDQNTYNLFKIS
jgi:TatD DNase family protein